MRNTGGGGGDSLPPPEQTYGPHGLSAVNYVDIEFEERDDSLGMETIRPFVKLVNEVGTLCPR
jgi:hypothetical protein